MGMLTNRMGGISIVDGGEEVTTEGEIDKRDRVEKSNLFGDGVCIRYQSVACLVERRWKVHTEVVMLEDNVAGDEG